MPSNPLQFGTFFFFSFLFICIIYNSYGETQMSELHLSLFNISI